MSGEARKGRPGFHGVARGRRRARNGGQILVLALLAITLLVGLVFYVYNLGWQVNRRLETQNTADAAAISGAVWMARSMNVVAMNNVAQARLIALVPILDSVPLATEMAAEETAEWEKCLSSQLDRGVPATEGDYLKAGLRSLQQRMAAQRDILNALNGKLNPQLNGGTFDMMDTTHWFLDGSGGAPPHGKMWQAAVALDELSQATVRAAGLLAQTDAVSIGRANRADVALLVPVMPSIPALRGRFGDFQPVLEGYLRVDGDGATMRPTEGNGGAIVDMAYPHRLGPWARLFQCRRYIRQATGREYVPPTRQGPTRRTRGGGPHVSLQGRRVGDSARDGGGLDGSDGYWRATGWKVMGYTTYGPYRWSMDHIHWHTIGDRLHPGELPDTYFYHYENRLTRIKRGYVFSKDPALVEIHYPRWVTSYSEARRLAQEDDSRVHSTMFYQVQIVSSVPEGEPGWLSPGTFRTNGERPVSIWVDGWQDPERWPIPKVADYVWKDTYDYETNFDYEIGLRPEYDATSGRLVWHPVYVVDWYVWGGIDVGGPVEVRNPCNWVEDDELPAPILLDTSAGDYTDAADEGWRREKFTYLGVARKVSGAEVWPQRFSNVNPLNSIVTVAQAQVFNNRSWDLWTQDWQAQLVPVSRWDDWVSRLYAGIDDVPATEGQVSQEQLQAIYQYMSRIREEMAELYLRH